MDRILEDIGFLADRARADPLRELTDNLMESLGEEVGEELDNAVLQAAEKIRMLALTSSRRLGAVSACPSVVP